MNLIDSKIILISFFAQAYWAILSGGQRHYGMSLLKRVP
jgi:hypothetical protein